MLTHSKPGCGEFTDYYYLVHWYLEQEVETGKEAELYNLYKFTHGGLCGREVNPPYGRRYCERCMKKLGFLW